MGITGPYQASLLPRTQPPTPDFYSHRSSRRSLLSLFRLIFLHAHYRYHRLYIANPPARSNHRSQNHKATTSTADMLAKTVFAATFFALAQFAVASPPGCLLGAVNQYTDPSDLKSVCQAKDLTTQVAKFCGDDTKAALSAVADICNGQGVKVCTYSRTGRIVERKQQRLTQPQRPTSLLRPAPSSPAVPARPLLHLAPAASTSTPPTTALSLLRPVHRPSLLALVLLVPLAHLPAVLLSPLALLASSRLASLLLSLVSWLSLCRGKACSGSWWRKGREDLVYHKKIRRYRCICM